MKSLATMRGPVGLAVTCLLLVSLPDRGEGGGWYQDRPRLSVDYLHGPLADTLSRYIDMNTVNRVMSKIDEIRPGPRPRASELFRYPPTVACVTHRNVKGQSHDILYLWFFFIAYLFLGHRVTVVHITSNSPR